MLFVSRFVSPVALRFLINPDFAVVFKLAAEIGSDRHNVPATEPGE